ncbi:hypothetical protein JCM10212_003265 [Sporobolomyces blumeae]
MGSNAIREELVLLQSSVVDDELVWLDEAVQAEWEPALNDAELPAPPSIPSILLRIAPHAHLSVEYHLEKLPTFTLQAPTLPRDDQARLAAESDKRQEEVAREAPTLPTFTLFTLLKEYVAEHPLVTTALTTDDEAPPSQPEPKRAGPIQLKTTLIWSHHLLATSKRKDIVSWSTELLLWGISKPGYPGVIVVEGEKENVDEFVHRIKQLQWKALQIRCEEEGAVVTPPNDVPPREATEWAVRHRTHLGPNMSKDSHDKVCVREFEGLNEVGELMRKSGMEDIFLTALKISK